MAVSLSLSLSVSINFHEHSSGHFDLSRPFTERHHSLLLPTRPHACQPSHSRHAYRSLFRHMLATQRQHNDDDDDDDDDEDAFRGRAADPCLLVVVRGFWGIVRGVDSLSVREGDG